MEQQFKLRQIEDALKHKDSAKEDIITIFMALQRQCFCLSNSLTNLLKHWPAPQTQDLIITEEDLSKLGILFETKD